MKFAEREMDRLVDEIAAASKEEGSGYAHNKVVVDAVEQRLKRDGIPVEAKAQMIRRMAEGEVTRYWNRRKPKPTAQQSFYHPDMWLPLGDGKKVQLCDAGTADLITYGRNIEKNRRRIEDAAKLTSDYIDSRVKALNDNPGQRLDWIERNVFGWTVVDAPDLNEEEDPEEDSDEE